MPFIIDTLVRDTPFDEKLDSFTFDEIEDARKFASVITKDEDNYIVLVSESFGPRSEYGESIIAVWSPLTKWLTPDQDFLFSEVVTTFALHSGRYIG